MIPMLSIVLGRLAQLPFLQGKRTTISAVGLFGLCLYCLSIGQYEAGLTNLFFGLGLLGIRFRFTPGQPTLPSPPTPLPIPPAVPEPTLAELFDRAELLDRMMKPDTGPVVFGAVSNGERLSLADRRERRRSRREATITMLVNKGVSRFSVAVWLPIILALLEHLPEIIAVVNKIIDAIRNRKSPRQVLKEAGIPDSEVGEEIPF